MILVNNRDEIPWQHGMTVTKLLEVCRYTSPHIAVFVNGELVRRPQYESYPIADGADVRVLHMIAGG
jgi:sulfur carrier protein